MEFKNYCIVVFGDIRNVESEVRSMSETPINFFSPKEGSLFVATFSSLAEVSHLNEFFKGCKRTFIIYELNAKSSGQFFQIDEIQQGLFGFLNDENYKLLKSRTEEFLKVVTGTTVSPKSSSKRITDVKLITSDEYIDSLTSDQKNNLMNDIIKKGVKSLSEKDKELLTKLAK